MVRLVRAGPRDTVLDMKHSVPHDLPLPLAKKAADKALEVYAGRFAEFDPQIAWLTERTAEVTFKALGATLKGSFAISDNDIAMEMDVPMLMRPFRAKAMEVVEQKIREWIDKAKNGELI